jgi:predicted TPR repeat methyltransferase
MDKSESAVDPAWLQRNLTDPQEVTAFYDNWAANYDETLQSWHYKSPEVAATLMARYVSVDGRILDAGCGTGMTGKALQQAGFQHIIGLDLSLKSLAEAEQSAVYEQVRAHNLQERPFPFPDNHFAGLECIGVLTYIQDIQSLFTEYCRLVQPGGVIIFSQRQDLYEARDYASTIEQLVTAGLWQEVYRSEPMSYLPHPDSGLTTPVLYFVYRVKT